MSILSMDRLYIFSAYYAIVISLIFHGLSVFPVFSYNIAYFSMHFYAKIFFIFSNYLLHIYKIWCILSHVDRTAENFVLLYMNIYSLW